MQRTAFCIHHYKAVMPAEGDCGELRNGSFAPQAEVRYRMRIYEALGCCGSCQLSCSWETPTKRRTVAKGLAFSSVGLGHLNDTP